MYTTKTISGAYAECSLVTADSLHLIPGSLSFTEAAALPTPYLTAFRGLIQRGRASDTVLIYGSSVFKQFIILIPYDRVYLCSPYWT